MSVIDFKKKLCLNNFFSLAFFVVFFIYVLIEFLCLRFLVLSLHISHTVSLLVIANLGMRHSFWASLLLSSNTWVWARALSWRSIHIKCGSVTQAHQHSALGYVSAQRKQETLSQSGTLCIICTLLFFYFTLVAKDQKFWKCYSLTILTHPGTLTRASGKDNVSMTFFTLTPLPLSSVMSHGHRDFLATLMHQLTLLSQRRSHWFAPTCLPRMPHNFGSVLCPVWDVKWFKSLESSLGWSIFHYIWQWVVLPLFH